MTACFSCLILRVASSLLMRYFHHFLSVSFYSQISLSDGFAFFNSVPRDLTFEWFISCLLWILCNNACAMRFKGHSMELSWGFSRFLENCLCFSVRGRPLMIWGGPGGNREKQNFGGPSPGKKKFGRAFSRKK